VLHDESPKVIYLANESQYTTPVERAYTEIDLQSVKIYPNYIKEGPGIFKEIKNYGVNDH